jgi:hypothetical protein
MARFLTAIDNAEQEAEASKLGAEVNVTGTYDDNPTGR